MTTQYLRLLRSVRGQPDLLLEQLRQQKRRAEQQLARCFNRCHTNRVRHILVPDEQCSYDDCDPVLLALLWTLADNLTALDALARRFNLLLPAKPSYATMCPKMLAHLWELARDGNALVELWTREKKLPVAAITADTPEDILGLASWFYHGTPKGTAAWEELLRRYGLFDILRYHDSDTDRYAQAEALFLQRFRRVRWPQPFQSAREFASAFSEKLFHLVPRWDYVVYPSIEHLLVRAVDNVTRDYRRRVKHQPIESVTGEAARGISDKGHASPVGAVEVRDSLARHMDVGERLIRKAQEGLDLNDEELDYAASRNLEHDGLRDPSQEELDEEAERIAAWLAAHPKASGQDLRQCLPWFRPTCFGKEARVSRLRLFQGQASRGLADLLPETGENLQQLAERVDQAAEKLLTRTACSNRPSRKQVDPQSPVASFQEYDNGWRCLLHQLGNHRSLSHREADDLASARDAFSLFGDEFPILVKLAACRRLVRQLRDVLPNAAALVALAHFLDGGTKWLSSFPQRDLRRLAQLTPGLNALFAKLQGDSRAALHLLLLWLRSTDNPGLPDTRLPALTWAWQYLREVPSGRGKLNELANLMVEQAADGKWRSAGETADALLGQMGTPPVVVWSLESDLRSHLKQLRIRWSDLPTRLKACRQLLAYGKKNASGEIRELLEGWEKRLAALPESETHDASLSLEVRRCADTLVGQTGGGLLSALRLLALWTEPTPQSRFSEAALSDLAALWEYTYSKRDQWAREFATRIEGLVESAIQGDWQRLGTGASALLQRCPAPGFVGRGNAEDFRNTLTRLARRRGEHS